MDNQGWDSPQQTHYNTIGIHLRLVRGIEESQKEKKKHDKILRYQNIMHQRIQKSTKIARSKQSIQTFQLPNISSDLYRSNVFKTVDMMPTKVSKHDWGQKTKDYFRLNYMGSKLDQQSKKQLLQRRHERSTSKFSNARLKQIYKNNKQKPYYRIKLQNPTYINYLAEKYIQNIFRQRASDKICQAKIFEIPTSRFTIK